MGPSNYRALKAWSWACVILAGCTAPSETASDDSAESGPPFTGGSSDDSASDLCPSDLSPWRKPDGTDPALIALSLGVDADYLVVESKTGDWMEVGPSPAGTIGFIAVPPGTWWALVISGKACGRTESAEIARGECVGFEIKGLPGTFVPDDELGHKGVGECEMP